MKGQLTTGIGANAISLRDGAGALFRRRALVLFIFLIVVVGTAIVTFLLPNRYESRTTILVKNQLVDVAITAQQPGGEGQRHFNHLCVKFARTLGLRVAEARRALLGKTSEAESSNRRYGFLQRQSRRIRISITTSRTAANGLSTEQQSGGAEPAEGLDLAKDRGGEIKDARKRN